MTFYSAFQSNAFWNQAYQIARAASPVDTDYVGHPYIDPFTQQAVFEHKQAKERQRIKEEEIIRLRVEAQDALMRKREIAALNDENSRRQIAYFEAEYLRLQNEIMAQLAALQELQRKTVIRRNRLIMLLLMAASPFTINLQ